MRLLPVLHHDKPNGVNNGKGDRGQQVDVAYIVELMWLSHGSIQSLYCGQGETSYDEHYRVVL